MTPKPGIQTTELWVSVLTSVGALAAALAGQLSPRYAAIAAAVSSAAYAISRGITKHGVAEANAPKIVASVPTTPASPPVASV